MDQRELLPKKLFVFAILISVTYLVGIFSLTVKLSSQLKSIHNTHLPILEMSAINIRLGDSLKDRTRNLVYEFSPAVLEEYTLDRDSLNFNIKNYIKTLESSKLPIEINNNFDREALSNFESRVIELSRDGNAKEALKLLESQEYRSLESIFLNSIQSIAEQLSIQRDSYLEEQDRIIELGVISSAITFLLISGLWFRVYFSYKKNASDRRRALEELETERVKSSHNAKMASLGEMAAGLAHEINNPLTVIQGFSERLVKLAERNEFTEEKVERYAEKINSTSKRVTLMIQGLKAFSKSDSDKELSVTPVDSIIEDTLSFCREKFKSSGVDLHVVCDETEEVLIMARPVEMSQVLLNLLNNAFDELQGCDLIHSWIKVETKQDDEFVYISVADSGLGISDEVKEKIFNPFFTTKQGTHGTGLGLSISSSIVRKHNGQFYLDDSLTTEFIIKLPRPSVKKVLDAA